MTRGASEIAPSVMLSPNAMNFVLERVCETRTVTANPHDACAVLASVAVQRTLVSPIAKVAADPGVHSTVYGARPPVGAGASKWTSVPCGPMASRIIGRGHET